MPEPIKIQIDQIERPLVTREQLSGRLVVSKRQIEAMEKAGLPCFRFGKGGCLVRYSWPAVKEWLATETDRHLAAK